MIWTELAASSSTALRPTTGIRQMYTARRKKMASLWQSRHQHKWTFWGWSWSCWMTMREPKTGGLLPRMKNARESGTGSVVSAQWVGLCGTLTTPMVGLPTFQQLYGFIQWICPYGLWSPLHPEELPNLWENIKMYINLHQVYNMFLFSCNLLWMILLYSTCALLWNVCVSYVRKCSVERWSKGSLKLAPQSADEIPAHRSRGGIWSAKDCICSICGGCIWSTLDIAGYILHCK